MKLADRMERIPASATIAVTVKAAALRAAGHDVIAFGAGEPDFETPDHIREAAKRALDEGWTRYTPAAGLPAMRQAICDHVAEHFDHQVERPEVMVSCGGKHVLYNAMMSLCSPGDEVLLPAPYWVTYPVQVSMAGARAVAVDATVENGFRVTVEQLEAAVTNKTRGLILNSPSNPTGAGYNREELLAIAAFVEKHDLWVVSDEIYARLTYGSFESVWFATLPGMRERTLSVYGLSKTYAMTGWRIGIGVGPRHLIAAMSRMQGQVTTNPASVSQAGAIAALTGPETFLADWIAEFDRRRQAMVEQLNAIEGVRCTLPEGAFYAFPDLREMIGRRAGDRVLETDWDLIDYLLDEAGIALVPGTPFGTPGFARLSYATSMANIDAGLERMRLALAKLT